MEKDCVRFFWSERRNLSAGNRAHNLLESEPDEQPQCMMENTECITLHQQFVKKLSIF